MRENVAKGRARKVRNVVPASGGPPQHLDSGPADNTLSATRAVWFAPIPKLDRRAGREEKKGSRIKRQPHLPILLLSSGATPPLYTLSWHLSNGPSTPVDSFQTRNCHHELYSDCYGVQAQHWRVHEPKARSLGQRSQAHAGECTEGGGAPERTSYGRYQEYRYLRVGCSLLEAWLHRSHDRLRRPCPGTRIGGRGHCRPPQRHEPQGRGPGRYRAAGHLQRVRALPDGPIQRMRKGRFPFNATGRGPSPSICEPPGGLVSQNRQHVVREWRHVGTALRVVGRYAEGGSPAGRSGTHLRSRAHRPDHHALLQGGGRLPLGHYRYRRRPSVLCQGDLPRGHHPQGRAAVSRRFSKGPRAELRRNRAGHCSRVHGC